MEHYQSQPKPQRTPLTTTTTQPNSHIKPLRLVLLRKPPIEESNSATNSRKVLTNTQPVRTNDHSAAAATTTTTTTKPTPSSSKIPILNRSFSHSQPHPPTQYHYLQARHLQKPPSPTPSTTSSVNSTTDLFAGPRTSIHLDPLTGQLLSTGHDVSAMDALIDNLKNDPSSPQRRKAHQQRTSTKAISQHQPSSSSYSNPTRPPNRSSANRLPPSSSTSPRIGKIHTRSTNDLPSIQRHPTSPARTGPQPRPNKQPPRLSSTSDLNSQQSTQSSHPKFSARCFSRSSKNSSHHPSDHSHSLPPPLLLPPIRVPSASQTYLPPPTPPPSAIPSINGIIEKYSRKINYPVHRPNQSPQLKIDSIDEIVEKYNPLLKRSTRQDSTNHQTSHTQPSDLKHLSPLDGHHHHHPSSLPTYSRLRSLSENSDDSHSSINSLTKEALSLQAQLSSPSERASHSSHLLNSPSSSPKIYRPDSDSILKRSPSPIHPSPLNQPSTTEDRPSARAQVDDQIALYLRSTRLTTLIKLERQQSPMTVSLADVGSPTGHPVIVFLGLGCVRYLVGLYDELAEALGLRLICLDRWGLGKTTEVPDEQRGFLEWASVVEEVADQLAIGRFSILAHSAGAPYALACSLRLADRVHGSIHLLAPWVSMTAEGGINAGAYKWLKYIPNSMIKTVQAAEWKMTGWRLGKPPSLNHPPVGFDARAPVSSSHPCPLAGLEEEEQQACLQDEGPESDMSHRPSPPPNRKGSKRSGTSTDEYEQLSKSRVSAESSDRRSIITDSSMGRSRHTLKFNGSSSTLANGHKSGLFGKMFPSQSLPNGHDSSKPINLLSPCDQHNPSLAIRDSPHTTPLAFLLNPVASPVPSLRGSFEDETEEKPGPLHHTKGHSKRTKMKFCHSESKYGNIKKQDDLAQVEARRTRSQTMLHQPPTHHGGSSNCSSSSSQHLPGKMEDLGVGVSSLKEGEGMDDGKSRMRRSLGISLLRASYSESLRGGTSDLITILEKNSKPWGFTYAEISKPVKIWHGSKDERLSAKGSQWFINSIAKIDVKNRSELSIVNDATHSLMTDVNVLYQVFESIADQWSSSNPENFSISTP